MIDGSEKRNRQLVFEHQNSHVCEKRSNAAPYSVGHALLICLEKNKNSLLIVLMALHQLYLL